MSKMRFRGGLLGAILWGAMAATALSLIHI